MSLSKFFKVSAHNSRLAERTPPTPFCFGFGEKFNFDFAQDFLSLTSTEKKREKRSSTKPAQAADGNSFILYVYIPPKTHRVSVRLRQHREV